MIQYDNDGFLKVKERNKMFRSFYIFYENKLS